MIKNIIFSLLLVGILVGCNSKYDRFPLDKRYWDNTDYEDVIRYLKYSFEDEKLPSLDDPETRLIFQKFTDAQNYIVVLDDKELGLKYRNEFASNFFKNWKNMNSIYRETDRKDNYIYDKEMVEVFKFGLGLQLRYFKLGNDEILAVANDENSRQIKDQVNSNVKTLIKNFQIYLDEINNEKALSNEGKILFSRGIDKYFPELIELYPNANYSELKNKMISLEKKSESEPIKASLNKIIKLIESKKEKESMAI